MRSERLSEFDHCLEIERQKTKPLRIYTYIHLFLASILFINFVSLNSYSQTIPNKISSIQTKRRAIFQQKINLSEYKPLYFFIPDSLPSEKDLENLKLNAKQYIELFKKEPNHAETQQIALNYFSVPSEKQFKTYRQNARKRNLLPTIDTDFDYARAKAIDYDFDTVNPNPGSSSGSGTYNHTDWGSGYFRDRDLSVGISAQWNLNDVLYDDEITDILSEQRRYTTIKLDLIDEVRRAYFERRRSYFNTLLNPPKDLQGLMFAEMEIQELTSKLDALTGGWFGKEVISRR